MTPQQKQLVSYLKKNKSITYLKAQSELGCGRLAARIGELKEQGFSFTTKMVKVKNRLGEDCRVAEYRLVSK